MWVHYMDGELCKRRVVDSAERVSYKQFGVAGGSSATETLCSVLAGQTYVSQNGQHNSDDVYKQTKGYSPSSPVATDTDSPDMG